PNLHVEDMTDLYLMLLEQPDDAINGKTWNAGYHNLKVRTIADMVREEVGQSLLQHQADASAEAEMNKVEFLSPDVDRGHRPVVSHELRAPPKAVKLLL